MTYADIEQSVYFAEQDMQYLIDNHDKVHPQMLERIAEQIEELNALMLAKYRRSFAHDYNQLDFH